MVNRFWILFLGNGLVKTQEEFYNQGHLPLHSELLDWMAILFRENSWDTKKFYNELSCLQIKADLWWQILNYLETDPENKWLARGPSYRLSAEQIRNNALAENGFLNPKIGGKYVFPYQPSGIWEVLATRNGTNYSEFGRFDLLKKPLPS